MKTVQFYNTCLDTAAVDQRGSAPLKKLIAEFGGWSVNGSFKNWPVTKRIGTLLRELGVRSLMSVNVGVDLANSSVHVVQVSDFSE